MKHPDHYDTDEKTSKRMSQVKLKKGKAETVLAKNLWHKGFRYHFNDKKLPGSPDIAILKYHIAIFVDGEFWHGYDWKNKKPKLKRNRDYWIEKIEENITRDRKVDIDLKNMGWVPLHFWSKEVTSDTEKTAQSIEELARDIRLEKYYEQDSTYENHTNN